MTSMQIYWILILDNIKDFVGCIGYIIVFMGVFALICAIISVIAEEISPRYALMAFGVLVFGILLVAINTFIPTTKQLSVILLAPKIINNEQIQEIPSKVLSITNEWIEELSTKKVVQ